MSSHDLVDLQRDLQQQVAARLPVVSGPSYPRAVKLLAFVLTFSVAAAGVIAMTGEVASSFGAPGVAEWGFLVSVAAVIGAGCWGVLTSQTRCDHEWIEQTWLWRKRVPIADITQLKLIRIPGLYWLFVPRLVVRTSTGITTFQAASPQVVDRFRLLAYGG